MTTPDPGPLNVAVTLADADTRFTNVHERDPIPLHTATLEGQDKRCATINITGNCNKPAKQEKRHRKSNQTGNYN